MTHFKRSVPEIEALYLMVYQTDLILLCGASGTGKTSLIQCGLANKFQPYEWLALSIRRGDNINRALEKALASPTQTQAVTDSHRLSTAADTLDWLDDHPAAATQTALSPLAQRLKNLYLQHFKPVFLIFDQFEELYILGSKDEQRQFTDSVREMLRIEYPVKIILSIREEYLGFLYEFERKVPELLHKKLRVEPMNQDKVQEVLRGMCDPARSLVRLRPGEEERFGALVFEKLKSHDNVRTIELPYLQVLLDKLYLQVTGDETRSREAEFSVEALEKMGNIGDLLANFLDDQVQKNARALQTTPENIKKLLAPFVTLDGTKDPLSAEQLHRRVAALGFSQDWVARALQAFQNSQVLRFDEKEQRYEVKHDSLARQISSYRDAEDIAQQKAAQVIRTQMLLEAKNREVFTEKQLLFIEPFLEKLPLTAAELDWVAESRAYWEKIRHETELRQKAELEAAQRQAEQERELRTEAEQAQRRSRQGARVAATAAMLAALGLGFAVFLYNRSVQQNAAIQAAKADADQKLRSALEEKQLRLDLAMKDLLRKKQVYQDAENAYLIQETAVKMDSIARLQSANQQAIQQINNQ
jgi:hypothetical protein